MAVLAGATSLAFAANQVSGAPAEQAAALPIYGVVTGDEGHEGALAGNVADAQFTNENGALTFTGTLSGLVTFDDTAVRVEDQDLTTAVEPTVAGTATAGDGGQSGTQPSGWSGANASTSRAIGGQAVTGQEPDPGTCDVLYLDLQPITLNLLGLELSTSRITIDANATPGEGNLVGNLICALAGLLDGLPDTIDDVTDQLNELIREVGAGGTAARSLPVRWPLEGPDGQQGSFQGTVSDLAFSEQDGVLLDGVLNGIADTGQGPVRITDQPLSGQVTPSVVGAIPSQQFAENPTQPEPDPDKCDVLYLDIQPITLNLLGLEVLTSRITVDVNAIPGEGNLAGNLVCALAGLLDGTPDAFADITDQLNQLAGELGVASASATAASEPVGTTATDELGSQPSGDGPVDSISDGTQPAPEPSEPPAEPAPTEPPSEPTEPPSDPTQPPSDPGGTTA